MNINLTCCIWFCCK